MKIVVSVVVVTENRHAFLPWLYWNFTKQTHEDKELVIVDSSRHRGYEIPNDDRVRVIRAIPGTSIGAKLNTGVAVARGDVIVRFDDDDWQHPRALELKAAAFPKSRSGLVGHNHGFFLSLDLGRVCSYRGLAGGVVPLTVMIRRSLALAFPFPDKSQNEDTRWMSGLLSRVTPLVLEEPRFHSLWLRHGRNTSRQPARSWSASLVDVENEVGLDTWGSTTEELLKLRQRLHNFTKAD